MVAGVEKRRSEEIKRDVDSKRLGIYNRRILFVKVRQVAAATPPTEKKVEVQMKRHYQVCLSAKKQ